MGRKRNSNERPAAEKIPFGERRYDTPTPEKVAFGRRLRIAREMAEFDMLAAAQRLGYTKSTQLSYFEGGHRYPPPDMVPKMCELYGVTADYLFGLVDEPDRDPVAGVQRLVAARLAGDLRRMAEQVTQQVVPMVREYMPTAALGESLARATLETNSALQRLRDKCPQFDRLMPASALVMRMESASVSASNYLETAGRMRLAARVGLMHRQERVATGMQLSLLELDASEGTRP